MVVQCGHDSFALQVVVQCSQVVVQCLHVAVVDAQNIQQNEP